MFTYKSPFKPALLLLGLILFFSVQDLAAQQLDFDEINVIAPYEPTISDAFKINFTPQIVDTIEVDIAFDYRISPTMIPVKFDPKPLSPARMRGEPLAKLYKGQVKAGIGSYTTPYLEAFYNTLRSNEYAYGVQLKHLSSTGKLEDYAHSGYADNLFNIYGKRFWDNHTLAANLDLQSNMVHYYGFKPEDYHDDYEDFINDLSKKDYRQRFLYASPSVNLSSNYLDSTKLQHDIELQYYYLSDRYDATEQSLGFNTKVGRSLGEDPMGFAERQHFEMDFSIDYFHNQDLLDTTNKALFQLTPTLSSSYQDFDFYVGINTALQADEISYMRFYPKAGAQVNLIDEVLYAYATLSGEMKKHSMQSFSRRNPFANTSLQYAFMSKKSELKGGFKGSISSYASYNISVTNSTIDNYPFFVTDFSNPLNFDAPLNNTFDVVYDDIRLFNFNAEVFSNIGERLKVRFAADYYEFTMDEQDQPWHEPTVKLTLNFLYNMQDKILLTADTYARNSVYARVIDENNPFAFTSEEIHGFHVDVNFGIEYRYTKILSVFLNLNNVQNQPLERWYNYPSQKFNILGGVTYAF